MDDRGPGKRGEYRTSAPVRVGFKSPLPQEELRHYHEWLRALALEERGALRLEFLMVTTPFFADCLTAMQRLAVLGTDGVTLQQMYERLTVKYGDRSTVLRQVRYVLQTLALLGVVRNDSRKWFLTSPLLRQVPLEGEDTTSAE